MSERWSESLRLIEWVILGFIGAIVLLGLTTIFGWVGTFGEVWR